MAKAVLISTVRRTEITSAIAVASKLWWMLSLIGAAGVALFGPQIYMSGAVLFAAGVGSYAVLLLSWHYYRPRASIYAWLGFSIAIAISIVGGLVLPSVRQGDLPPLGALFAIVGFLGSGIALPLIISAARLRRWASE
jgi:hypothetical protein